MFEHQPSERRRVGTIHLWKTLWSKVYFCYVFIVYLYFYKYCMCFGVPLIFLMLHKKDRK